MGYTRGFRWTPERIQFLKDSVLKMTNKEIAENLGTNHVVVSGKICALKMKRPFDVWQKHRVNAVRNSVKAQEWSKGFGQRMANDETRLKAVRESEALKASTSIRTKKMWAENSEFRKKKIAQFEKMIAETKNFRKSRIGEGNSNWKGGVSFEIGHDYRGRNWETQRTLARKRDNFTCQKCGQKEELKNHDVHHKVPFREFKKKGLSGEQLINEANNLDNLITLCSTCHSRHERLHGDNDNYQLI